MKRAVRLVLAGFLSFAASVYGASPPSSYPARPIRIVDAFVPGGPSDLLSRLLGQKLTESRARGKIQVRR